MTSEFKVVWDNIDPETRKVRVYVIEELEKH